MFDLIDLASLSGPHECSAVPRRLSTRSLSALASRPSRPSPSALERESTAGWPSNLSVGGARLLFFAYGDRLIWGGWNANTRLKARRNAPNACLSGSQHKTRSDRQGAWRHDAGGVVWRRGGIRTLSGSLESVTYRIHNADNAMNAADAVARCPPLPADNHSSLDNRWRPIATDQGHRCAGCVEPRPAQHRLRRKRQPAKQ